MMYLTVHTIKNEKFPVLFLTYFCIKLLLSNKNRYTKCIIIKINLQPDFISWIIVIREKIITIYTEERL